ncbi:unnamed protein product [Gadus morhua 'NCC']
MDALIWQKRIAAASTFFCYLQWDELPLEVFQLYSRENDCPPKKMWTPPTGLVKPPASCTCPAKSFDLAGSIPTANRADIQKRRAEEYKKHQARTSSILNTLLFAQSNSPLQYPIQGFTVRPLVPTLIPGLALHGVQRSGYKVSLLVTKGVLCLGSPSDVPSVEGGKKWLILETLSLEELNKLLADVTYTLPVTTYTPETWFTFRLSIMKLCSQSLFGNHPYLCFSTWEQTLATKRKCSAIRHAWGTGLVCWQNPGCLSSHTKYFLWVDDDFLFTEKTKIEDLVEVMEATPELDVVGGSVTGNQFYFSIAYEEGDGVTGGCMDRKPNIKFQSLPNYPQCSIVNGVVNFFLARTDAVNRVRFDPKLKRVAHSEFFMDGLGQLMVASCGHVSIGHQPRGANAQYGRFRHPGKDDVQFKLQLHYYKNHLQCIHYG